MAQVVYAEEALADLERIVEHLLRVAPKAAPATLADVRSAVDVLGAHPLIGRRVRGELRELAIAHGARGYVALYRFDEGSGTVRVLRLRSQREAGYSD